MRTASVKRKKSEPMDDKLSRALATMPRDHVYLFSHMMTLIIMMCAAKGLYYMMEGAMTCPDGFMESDLEGKVDYLYYAFHSAVMIAQMLVWAALFVAFTYKTRYTGGYTDTMKKDLLKITRTMRFICLLVAGIVALFALIDGVDWGDFLLTALILALAYKHHETHNKIKKDLGTIHHEAELKSP